VSWAVLAPALGVTSRQAAERRYLRLRPSDTGERTGEQRVRAQRDNRAGDRAVAAWARDNAAVLRQLAGQISALRDLRNSARRHADLVGQALADNDPTSLFVPLADTRLHLKATHAGLAAQIQSITDQTTRIRHTTTRRGRAHYPLRSIGPITATEHLDTSRGPAPRDRTRPRARQMVRSRRPGNQAFPAADRADSSGALFPTVPRLDVGASSRYPTAATSRTWPPADGVREHRQHMLDRRARSSSDGHVAGESRRRWWP